MANLTKTPAQIAIEYEEELGRALTGKLSEDEVMAVRIILHQAVIDSLLAYMTSLQRSRV